MGKTVPGTGKQSETRQLKSKEIIKTSTPSRLHLKNGNFEFTNSIFAQNWLTNISEKGYKNKIDDENTGRYQTSDIRGHPASGHLKTDDSDSSNDGDDDKYVVYGYVKNEKAGSDHEDSESDSKDHDNDKECMNYLQIYAFGEYQLEKRGWKKSDFSRCSKEV